MRAGVPPFVAYVESTGFCVSSLARYSRTVRLTRAASATVLAGDAALLRTVCLHESSVHRQLVAAYQSNCQASGHNFLEQLLEHLRFLKPPVAILLKGGVMRNLLIETETYEPAPLDASAVPEQACAHC
jgi:hypothetical protein